MFTYSSGFEIKKVFALPENLQIMPVKIYNDLRNTDIICLGLNKIIKKIKNDIVIVQYITIFLT